VRRATEIHAVFPALHRGVGGASALCTGPAAVALACEVAQRAQPSAFRLVLTFLYFTCFRCILAVCVCVVCVLVSRRNKEKRIIIFVSRGVVAGR